MRAPSSDVPVELAGVSVAARGLAILDNISLSIPAGAPTLLIGPNGAGKTTLLRVLMGLQSPDSGHLTWGGNRAPRGRRAIMFQRPVMLRRSAAANLRFALDTAGAPAAEHQNRVTELFDLVGLRGLERRPARRLSGGEQQRLALARALAGDPDILLLDEPAAGLDPAATKAIEDIVHAIAARGTKVIMSTHDLGQARRLAGDVVLLHRGRIVETGPTAEIFATPRTEAARRFIAGELLL